MDFEIVEDLAEVEPEPTNRVYELPSREGMIYCEFCKGWYFPEYHYGDVSND